MIMKPRLSRQVWGVERKGSSGPMGRQMKYFYVGEQRRGGVPIKDGAGRDDPTMATGGWYGQRCEECQEGAANAGGSEHKGATEFQSRRRGGEMFSGQWRRAGGVWRRQRRRAVMLACRPWRPAVGAACGQSCQEGAAKAGGAEHKGGTEVQSRRCGGEMVSRQWRQIGRAHV